MAQVLVFPAGLAVANEICASLRGKDIVSSLIGVSSDDEGKDLTNPFHYDHVFYNAPSVHESALEIWIEYLSRFEWTHAVPTMDSAVYLFSKLASYFPGKWFMAPSLETCEICFSKRKTYVMLPSVSPKLFDYCKCTQWYVKPDVGCASRGCKEVTYEEAQQLHKDLCWVVCERIDGDEFTVHCYSSRIIGARKRTITKAGISMLTHNSVPSREIRQIFDRILEKIKHPPGPWFFQIKGSHLLEVEPRIPAGGSAARYFWNHNGILQWLYDAMAQSLSSSKPIHTSSLSCSKAVPIRAVLKSYQDHVFLDEEQFDLKAIVVGYDDTLFDLKMNDVDADLIGALYGIYRLCPIYLVTRHHGDLLSHMKKNIIPVQLFHKIIHVPDEKQTKWEACVLLGEERNHAILIDDSYREREEWQRWSCDRDEGVTIIRSWKLSNQKLSNTSRKHEIENN
ncbi:unnamed protein product [Rotaria sp. Silwood1]|nr:unnamed protein product [Rotaria sp. Silwood1]